MAFSFKDLKLGDAAKKLSEAAKAGAQSVKDAADAAGLDDAGRKLSETLKLDEAGRKLSESLKLDEAGRKLDEAKQKFTDAADAGLESARQAAADVKGRFDGSVEAAETARKVQNVRKNAVKLIFCMILADGEVSETELSQFDEIGQALDEAFGTYRDRLVEECRAQVAAKEKDYGYLNAVKLCAQSCAEALADPELFGAEKKKGLLWNLLATAYTGGPDASEKELLEFAAEKLGIDAVILQEMELYYQTVTELDREMAWLKESERPFKEIEPLLNEVTDRRTVIDRAINDLIADRTCGAEAEAATGADAPENPRVKPGEAAPENPAE